MRRNTFGDVYCHTADEVRRHVDEQNDADWLVYATTFDPPESTYKATCEVLKNVDGDLVCYIEADTLEQVRAIVRELRLEVQ